MKMETLTVEATILEFCREFVKNPYLCYTEEGLHALFSNRLISKVSRDEDKYGMLAGKKVSLLQNEYPSAQPFNDNKRGHWDIALLKSPLTPIGARIPQFDYLEVDSAVEFALNMGAAHLRKDIARLCPIEPGMDSHVKNKYVVHLYRLMKLGSSRFSNKDMSAKNKEYISENGVLTEIDGSDVVVYYARVTKDDESMNTIFRIDRTGIHEREL